VESPWRSGDSFRARAGLRGSKPLNSAPQHVILTVRCKCLASQRADVVEALKDHGSNPDHAISLAAILSLIARAIISIWRI
jgi:hypothetical protein